MSGIRDGSNSSGVAGRQYSVTQPLSTEEVLASIRRILAAEQSDSSYVQAPGELLLDNSMRVFPADDLPVSSSEFPVNEAVISSPVAAFVPVSDTSTESYIPQEGVVDEQVAKEIIDSIGSLLRGIGADCSVMIDHKGVTLEDVVREELRPLLKSWLDAHLPAIVERVVQAEVRRLADMAQRR